VIVGTSAGSLTGSLLRLGVPAAELSTWVVGGEWQSKFLGDLAMIQAGLPAFDLRCLLGGWRWPTWRNFRAAVAHQPLHQRIAALSRFLPLGSLSIAGLDDVTTEVFGGHIPPGLSICTTRLYDGERVVFSEASIPSVPLLAALMASCAIPAYLAPATIDGVEYVDGGVTSPTNADVLVDNELDVVIVISPMSLPIFAGRGVDAPVRWLYGRQLRAEKRMLENAGTQVLCIEPGRRSAYAMGTNFMATGRSDRVAQSAFFETGRKIADPSIRELLAKFTRAGTGRERIFS
jgi:NTE family protein